MLRDLALTVAFVMLMMVLLLAMGISHRKAGGGPYCDELPPTDDVIVWCVQR